MMGVEDIVRMALGLSIAATMGLLFWWSSIVRFERAKLLSASFAGLIVGCAMAAQMYVYLGPPGQKSELLFPVVALPIILPVLLLMLRAGNRAKAEQRVHSHTSGTSHE